MKQFRFLDWTIYSLAQDLFSEVIKITQELPREYRFNLGDQIIRAAFSVVLNIAEGSGKRTDADLGRFLDISLGSLYEIRAAVDTLQKLNILTKKIVWSDLQKKIEVLAQQIGGFRRSLS